MKFSRRVVWALGAAVCVSTAFAAEIGGVYTGSVWAEGVNQDGGWYDVNKSSTDTRDDMMCYAASAANLVAWWQKGNHLTSAAPTELSDIWSVYLEHSKNHASGGDPLAAINWWISGVYAPTNAAESERSIFNQLPVDSEQITLRVFDGFYYDQYALSQDNLITLLSYETVYTDVYFGDLLREGAGVSLFLKSDVGNLAHAITLWGVDYTDDGQLSKLWVTDSDDDAIQGIFSIDVLTADNGKVYFDEDGDIGDYEFYKYMGVRGIHIYGVSAIHPDAAATWQLVPEPTTATLSMLALAAMALRRRR